MPNGNLQGTCPGKDEGECRRLGWSNLELRPKKLKMTSQQLQNRNPNSKKYLNGQKVDILEIAREAKGLRIGVVTEKEMVGQKGLS